MEFRACCCLSPRAGAVLAGILDTIIGIIGTLAVGCLIFGIEDKGSSIHSGVVNASASAANDPTTPPPSTVEGASEIDASESERRNAYANGKSRADIATANYLYAFSALTTLLLGIILLVAAWKKNAGLAKAALILNLVNILGCIAGTVGLFVLGIHWHTLFPVAIAVILQIYFFWIVFDYQKYFNYSQPLNLKPRA